jgi:hypothetical protein
MSTSSSAPVGSKINTWISSDCNKYLSSDLLHNIWKMDWC